MIINGNYITYFDNKHIETYVILAIWLQCQHSMKQSYFLF